jgi:hypothetical protein
LTQFFLTFVHRPAHLEALPNLGFTFPFFPNASDLSLEIPAVPAGFIASPHLA